MFYSSHTLQELSSMDKLTADCGVLIEETECSDWGEEKQLAQHGHPHYRLLAKKIRDWCDVRNERQREELIKAASHIQESREHWEHSVKTWRMAAQMAYLREKAWACGTDAPGWDQHPYFSFKLNRRYLVEAPAAARAALGAPLILDFCTPEGRSDVIDFVENGLDHQECSYGIRMAKFKSWERRFQKWMDGQGCRLTREIQRRRLVSSSLASPAQKPRHAIRFRMLV